MASNNTSKIAAVFGWIVSLLPVAALGMSAVMKFSKSDQVLKGFSGLGWPDKLATRLGIVELSCAILYLIPRTAGIGAILVTGYLGGAVATHARLEQPQMWLPAGLGVLAWFGLYLRDSRVRSLIPLRQK